MKPALYLSPLLALAPLAAAWLTPQVFALPEPAYGEVWTVGQRGEVLDLRRGTDPPRVWVSTDPTVPSEAIAAPAPCGSADPGPLAEAASARGGFVRLEHTSSTRWSSVALTRDDLFPFTTTCWSRCLADGPHPVLCASDDMVWHPTWGIRTLALLEAIVCVIIGAAWLVQRNTRRS